MRELLVHGCGLLGNFDIKRTLDVLHDHWWEYYLPFIKFAYSWSGHFGIKNILGILHEHWWEYCFPFIEFAYSWSGNFGGRKTLDVFHERLWEYHFPFIELLHERLWEYHFPIIELLHERLREYHLSFNRTMHTATSYCPFEIIYGFNLFSSFDLMHLPVDDRSSLDGHFQILDKVNDTSYLADLPGKNHVFAIFNVTDFFPFDPGRDSRSNPFEERGNDGPQGGPSLKDQLQD